MIMLTKKTIVLALVFFAILSFTYADTLVLKDGQMFQGTFRGGDKESVIFEVEGELLTISLIEISTITFSPREAPPQQNVSGAVTIPAGSRILVNLTETVSTASHKAGASFSGVLATGLAVNGQVVVPPGTKIHGKVLESRGGRVVGGSRLVMTFTDLEINRVRVPLLGLRLAADQEPARVLLSEEPLQFLEAEEITSRFHPTIKSRSA